MLENGCQLVVATQLKAPSMSFGNRDGLSALFMYASFWFSQSCAAVMFTIRASIAARLGTDPICCGPMAPVMIPAAISPGVKIFSKDLLMHERIEISHRFLGFVVSVRPGIGIGTHFAIFQLGGYILCQSRLLNSEGGSVGHTLVVAVTILSDTLSGAVPESSIQVFIAYAIS